MPINFLICFYFIFGFTLTAFGDPNEIDASRVDSKVTVQKTNDYANELRQWLELNHPTPSQVVQKEAAEQEQRRLAEEAQRQAAEQEQRRLAEEAQRQAAEQEQRRLAKEAQRQAEQEQQQQAEEAQRQAAEQEQRRLAEEAQKQTDNQQQAKVISDTDLSSYNWMDAFNKYQYHIQIPASNGYVLKSAPSSDAPDVGIKHREDSLMVVGHIDVDGQRFYMTEWSWSQYNKGKKPNWVLLQQPNALRTPLTVAHLGKAGEGYASTNNLTWYYVTGLNPKGDNFLSLRSGPGKNYVELRRMGSNTLLQVIKANGIWLKIKLEDGTVGWACRNWIKCCK